MDEKGVYAIARSLWDSDAFMNQRYTQREAWLWLIGAAVWKQTRVNLDGKRVTLERGEFAFSVRFLALKWKWSKSSVSRFIILLEKRDMIRDTGRDGVTVFSISKYNDFQVVGLPKRDTERDADRDLVGTPVGQTRDKEETLQTLEALNTEEAAPKAAVFPKPLLPDWLDREAWQAFLEMRRRKRAPVTARAIELLIRKLDGWRQKGHDPTTILDASTASAWTDLYEPKPDTRNGKQPSSHDKFLAAGASLIRDYLPDGPGSGDGGAGLVETGRPLLPS